MDWRAVSLSLQLAAVTTAVLVVIGVPIAAWLAYSPRRWKVVAEVVVGLPLVLPPTVLGFWLLVGMGPHSPVGQAWETLTGGRLVFTFTGLVIASVVYSLPFMVQPLTAAFASVDRRLLEASWTLGLSRWSTLARVVLPLRRGAFASACVLAFAHTVGEFGVVIMVGGNIPGITRTASVAVYDQVLTMEYGAAGKTSLVLLAIAAAALAATYTLGRRAWTPAPVTW